MLSDIPTFPPTVPTADDLLAVIDSSDRRSPKRTTVAQVVGAVAGHSGGGLAFGGVLSPIPGLVLEGGVTGRFRIEISPMGVSTFVDISSMLDGSVLSNAQSIAGGAATIVGTDMRIVMGATQRSIAEVTISNPSSNLDVLSASEDGLSGTFALKITRIS